MAEFLIEDGDIMAFADPIDMELSFDVSKAQSWQDADYDKYDVEQALG